MTFNYTSERNGTEREIFTFEVIGRGEVQLVDYERMIRKSMLDRSWKKTKKKKLSNVVVDDHIYDVIREKMEEA